MCGGEAARGAMRRCCTAVPVDTADDAAAVGDCAGTSVRPEGEGSGQHVRKARQEKRINVRKRQISLVE